MTAKINILPRVSPVWLLKTEKPIPHNNITVSRDALFRGCVPFFMRFLMCFYTVAKNCIYSYTKYNSKIIISMIEQIQNIEQNYFQFVFFTAAYGGGKENTTHNKNIFLLEITIKIKFAHL